MRRATVLILPIALGGCFSSFHVTRFRDPTPRPARDDKVAMMPLMILGAQERVNQMTWMPGFIKQTWSRRPIGAAEYTPAASITQQTLARAFSDRQIVTPDVLTSALEGARHEDIESAIRDAAAKTGVDAVVTVEISGYEARNAGLENAQASGRVGVVLYDSNAKLVWSLSASVVKGPVGTNAAPTLTQFISYAMERLEPEIREMARG